MTPEPHQVAIFWTRETSSGAEVCSLWRHTRGWEVRLSVYGAVTRRQVQHRRDTAEDLAHDWLARVEA